MRLMDKIKTNKMSLIVSLPKNDIDLAKAALNGGADAIKVHTNVWHRASNNVFPPFLEQIELLKKIIDSVSIPVGLVPGGENSCVTENEIKIIKSMGFDFISMFVHHMPLYIYKSGITIMATITNDYKVDDIKALDDLNVDIIEADMVKDDKKDIIRLCDLMSYKKVVKALNKPVCVPTQRIINQNDVIDLYNIGVKCLMIGVIVTGDIPGELENITKSYRKEIDIINRC